MLLDSGAKEHAEALLAHWVDAVDGAPSEDNLEPSLKVIGRLDLPADVRRSFPGLLTAFLEFLEERPGFPQAGRWAEVVSEAEPAFLASFRPDGSVRGDTVRNPTGRIGRNDPCPCGSGRKYKKCCGR